VIHRARHLHEDRLFDCYLAHRAGDAIDPPAAEHLADCAACAAKYAELVGFLDGVRADGVTESDAVFTPERLRAQQQQIARRIEHVGRPARVLSFPSRVVRRTMTMTASTTRTVPRWAAAAAAAGLFIGVAVGSYQYGSRGRVLGAHLTPQNPTVERLAPKGVVPPLATSDDTFLSDLELALERPQTRELRAFDAFTPHVREIRDAR